MNKKIVSILAVFVMLCAPMVVMISDDSEARTSSPVTVHPVPSEYRPWVSTVPFTKFGNFTLYFTEDPYEEAVKYTRGEITLDQLKTRCGYTDSYPGNTSTYYTFESYDSNSVNCRSHLVDAYQLFESSFFIYVTQDPSDELRNYFNREITFEELKTRCGYTTSYSSENYYISYNGGSSVYVSHQGIGDNISLENYKFALNMQFERDPYDDAVKYIDGEITLDELKTRCGYIDSMYYSSQYYYLYFNSGALISQKESSRTIKTGLNQNVEAYFTDNPYDEVVRYLNDEITLTDLKSRCGYTEYSDRVVGTAYYCVSISGSYYRDINESDEQYMEFIPISPNYIFLEQGKYHIAVTDTDLKYVGVKEMVSSGRGESIEIKDRVGSVDLTIKQPSAIYFTGSSDNSGWYDTLENTWREKSITYTIDPEPGEVEKVSEFNKGKIKILTDREWVRMTTVDSLTGRYALDDSDSRMFVSGSDEEKEFLRDIVNKGLIDSSGYGSREMTVDGKKIAIYKCRETSSSTSSSTSLRKYTENFNYEYEYVECKMEKMSVSNVKPYKFYANYDFSIAVKYDTTQIKAVVMMCPSELGGTQYSVLESGRKYDLHMVSSAEYELYAIPVMSSSTTLNPSEVSLYTANVAEPDSNGMLFAVVAIVLCAVAFFVLFRSGHRPKWDEDTGLPSKNEVVQKEMPPKE